MPHSQELDFTNTEVAFSSKTNKELREMKWLFGLMNNQRLVDFGSQLALFAVKHNFPFAQRIIKRTLFKHFCGGTSIFECQPKIDKLFLSQVATILDFGAEAKESEEDFDETMKETLKAIDFAASNNSVPIVSSKISGLGRFDLLAKLQAGKTLSEPEMTELAALKNRVFSLCEHAEKRGVGIMIDAEETWVQDVIDDLVEELMEQFNKEKVVVYNTYQMYRKDKLDDLHQAYENARADNYLLGAKLVRGAYMVKERERAENMHYPSPIQNTKADTDRDYNKALKFCVDHYEYIGSCNATHNVESCRLQAEWIANKDIANNHPRLNFCQLYGMSDYITFNLANKGYNVAKYVPYGPVKDVVPYLIRRAQENTAMTGEMSRELSLIEKEIERRG
jgi:proline dehydrogenase